MSHEDWKPSQAYIDYAATMKKYGTLRTTRGPFEPCADYDPMPVSCATCRRASDEGRPCDLEVMAGINRVVVAIPPRPGGDLSTPVAGNDGSDGSEPGGN